MPGVKLLRTYGFSLLLLAAIALGLLVGQLAPATALLLRPLGDLFLNLVFMLIVPLTFFTISSSLAVSGSGQRLSRISTVMLAVFLFTSVIAAVLSLAFMYVVDPSPGAGIVLGKGVTPLPSPPAFLRLARSGTCDRDWICLWLTRCCSPNYPSGPMACAAH